MRVKICMCIIAEGKCSHSTRYCKWIIERYPTLGNLHAWNKYLIFQTNVDVMDVITFSRVEVECGIISIFLYLMFIIAADILAFFIFVTMQNVWKNCKWLIFLNPLRNWYIYRIEQRIMKYLPPDPNAARPSIAKRWRFFVNSIFPELRDPNYERNL